jgi:hypothetical protein
MVDWMIREIDPGSKWYFYLMDALFGKTYLRAPNLLNILEITRMLR